MDITGLTGLLKDALPLMLKGALWTLLLAVASVFFGAIIGTLVAHRLAASGVKWIVEKLPNGETLDRINEQQLLDRKVMKRLGAALELPAEMFALRAAETVLSEKLRLVEQELKGAKK